MSRDASYVSDQVLVHWSWKVGVFRHRHHPPPLQAANSFPHAFHRRRVVPKWYDKSGIWQVNNCDCMSTNTRTIRLEIDIGGDRKRKEVSDEAIMLCILNAIINIIIIIKRLLRRVSVAQNGCFFVVMLTLINNSSGGTLLRPTIMLLHVIHQQIIILILCPRYGPLYNLSELALGRYLTPCRNRFYNVWYT